MIQGWPPGVTILLSQSLASPEVHIEAQTEFRAADWEEVREEMH